MKEKGRISHFISFFVLGLNLNVAKLEKNIYFQYRSLPHTSDQIVVATYQSYVQPASNQTGTIRGLTCGAIDSRKRPSVGTKSLN